MSENYMRVINALKEEFPQWMHGLTGMNTTGERGESHKGLFITGNESEHGLRATMDRMRDNIRRHGWNPYTGERENTPAHIADMETMVKAQDNGMPITEREDDHLRGYVESYGQTFAPQVAQLVERAHAYL